MIRWIKTLPRLYHDLPKIYRGIRASLNSLEFQWYWPCWYDLRPSFARDLIIEDFGMPEYALYYPSYYGYAFSMGPFQARWYGGII